VGEEWLGVIVPVGDRIGFTEYRIGNGVWGRGEWVLGKEVG
jgi:hypothetical protein